jgi:hypothetical protein
MLLLFILLPFMSLAMEQAVIKPLIVFNENITGRWQIVNDGVMGGLSQSTLVRNERGNAVFMGDVSLRNNGGFASVRTQMPFNLQDFDGFVVRVKGDGKVYCLRIRTAQGNFLTRYSFEARFQTNGEWQEIYVPFSEFKPVFRGSQLRNVPDLDRNSIAELGFMIRDGQEGRFNLEIESISAYKNGSLAESTGK